MHRRNREEHACRDAVRQLSRCFHQPRHQIHFEGRCPERCWRAVKRRGHGCGVRRRRRLAHARRVTVVQSPMPWPATALHGCLHEGWLFKRAVSARSTKWKRRWLVECRPHRVARRAGRAGEGRDLLDEAARRRRRRGHMVVQARRAESACARRAQDFRRVGRDRRALRHRRPSLPHRRRRLGADRDGGVVVAGLPAL